MTVREMFTKYCKTNEDGEFICRGHCVTLDPATEEELEGFRQGCKEHNVEPRIIDELVEFYSQSNSLFNYFVCNDPALFDWWQDDEQRSIWLGCLDDDSFIYDDIRHKYAIGFAGNNDVGEYDSLMEMLESYLKEGYENGYNE